MPVVEGTPTTAGGSFGDKTVTKPSGDADGEIFLIQAIGFHYGTLGTITSTGFTTIANHTWVARDASEWRLVWLAKERTGSEGSTFTVVQSQSAFMNVICARVSGVDLSGGISAIEDVADVVRTARENNYQLPAVDDGHR